MHCGQRSTRAACLISDMQHREMRKDSIISPEFGVIPWRDSCLAESTGVTCQALICNFLPPAKGRSRRSSSAQAVCERFSMSLATPSTPSSRWPGDVRFSGFRMSRRISNEAPSQMLQNWVWNKKVLDTFAADYRDRFKKIPAELITKMKEAKLATVGVFLSSAIHLCRYRPHSARRSSRRSAYDCVAISNPIFRKISAHRSGHGAFVAFLDIWPVTMPAITVMPGRTRSRPTWQPSSKKRLTDSSTRRAGMKLRKEEIYAPGGSRARLIFRSTSSRTRSLDSALTCKSDEASRLQRKEGRAVRVGLSSRSWRAAKSGQAAVREVR